MRRQLARWVGIWLAVLVALAGMKLAGIEVINLFKDPIELSDADRKLPWNGTFSALLAMGWTAAATCCLLTASVLSRESAQRSYLFASGLVILALGLDDALVIHDHLVPYLTGMDNSDKPVVALLGLMTVVWGVRFRHQLLRSDLVLLALSGVGLGGAFAIDPLQSVGLALPGIGLIEEALKSLGLITLVGWTVAEAHRALRSATGTGPPPPPK